MRKLLLLLSVLLVFTPALKAQDAATDSLSIAMATVFGDIVRKNLDALRDKGIQINDRLFAERLALSLQGQSTGMTLNQANATIQKAFEPAAANDTVSAASQLAYLDAARATEGATVLPSGAVLIVIIEGEGAKPTAADTAIVSYSGQLSDGTVFDVTEEPIEMPVADLVVGFSEGLQQMLPGGTYRLVIPASAAYGSEGIPGIIPGGATLDFTVTLEGIKK